MAIVNGKYITLMVQQSSFSTTIGFLGSKSLEVFETKSNEKGRMLIPDMRIFRLRTFACHSFNANTEKEQLVTLRKLFEMVI